MMCKVCLGEGGMATSFECSDCEGTGFARERGADSMREVDLAKVHTMIDRLACSELPQDELELIVQLAEELERLQSGDWMKLNDVQAAEAYLIAKITRLRAANAKLVGALELSRIKVDSEGAVLAMAVDRLGGIVEGHATARLNFLQRIDELRDIEHQFRCLEGKIARAALDGQGGER